ncbi:hypothetical protein SHANETTE_26 [Bacillus phage Shanette]|uniref:Uncharacterized protein n=1 Tax=Bacillus phage Shanette TaxID=1296656 RepID=S5M4W7_9CAUD|nr:hypothetical protein AVV46_gp026 [Bacillus phage Shanette]AGR46931.1 hypothetical protein SHANETTE_26 [Bacillus phage Shanette]
MFPSFRAKGVVSMGVFSNELVQKLRSKYLEICSHKELLKEITGVSEFKEAEKAIKWELTKAKEQMAELMDKALRTMKLAANVERLWDDWYVVRHVRPGGETALELKCLIPGETLRLRRDGRNDRELTRADLDMYLPAMENTFSKHLWQDEVKLEVARLYPIYAIEKPKAKVVEMVNTVPGVLGVGDQVVTKPAVEEVEIVEPKQDNSVTVHAGGRFVQRKLLLHVTSLEKAQKHFLQNVAEIKPMILEAFHAPTTELLFEDEEGIAYYFDADNFVYLWGKADGRIITYYEEDFGFAKHINRNIVIQQVEELKNAFEYYKQLQVDNANEHESAKSSLDLLEDEEALLLAKLEAIKAHKKEITASLDLSDKTLASHKKEYEAERNKLFRKSKTN